MFVTPGVKVSFSKYGYLWLYMLRSFYAIDIVRETDSTHYGGTSLEFHWVQKVWKTHSDEILQAS